jgi:ABC-type nickel/cobalt efflux system permease component RcnA
MYKTLIRLDSARACLICKSEVALPIFVFLSEKIDTNTMIQATATGVDKLTNPFFNCIQLENKKHTHTHTHAHTKKTHTHTHTQTQKTRN